MLSHHLLPAQTSSVESAQTPAIAFLDSRLNDLPLLLAALNPAIQPYILHPAEDPILQIDAVLRSLSQIHSLYLFGHGSPGIMQLGRGVFNASTVTAHAALISQWQVQEIRLYGCQVGQQPGLLHQLQHLTGANIAASRHILGNGNWHLDVQLGEIQAIIPVQGAYPHHLPVELVQDINPGRNSSSPGIFTAFNNALYFSAYNSTTGREVWRIDSSNTVSRITDINPGDTNSSPGSFTVFNNVLYFSAYNSTTGFEMWRMDSNGNLNQVTDILPGAGNSNPTEFTIFNDALYFTAAYEVWRIDSNGSLNQVTNISPSYPPSNPSGLTVFNNALYFSANDGTNGRELWRVDNNGAVNQVRDINPGTDNSNPSSFTVFNNALYFQAEDGTNGRELWRVDSNGIASQVQDINPKGNSYPDFFAIFNNTLYFAAADGTNGRRELWRIDSNGTPSRVTDINPGIGYFGPEEFTIFNNALYFSATDDINGRELWRLDSNGTVSQVADINPGADSSTPKYFTVFNNNLYFSAYNSTDGRELWRIDSGGTASRVQDINLGVGDSFPDGFTVFNNTLYFSASNGSSGYELYRLTHFGVTITQSGSTTSVAEGGAMDTYTIVLDSQPTADVTITLTSNQVTTNTNTLVFTPQNWNVAQTVTVTAVNDTAVEGTHTGTITHTASSSDSSYNGIAIASVTANITDNDFPNTAPILSDTVVTLARVLPNAGNPTGAVGTLISQIADLTGGGGQNNISDPDNGAVAGIAITAVNTTNGSWFYSTNNGSTWNALGSVSNTNARLLAADANTRLYFRPNANYVGSVSNAVTFRAWDQTTGANGSLANTASNGSTTAFSIATDTAILEVKPSPTVDFNRDNNTDLLWHNATTGDFAVWTMDGATFLGGQVVANVSASSGWRAAGAGDLTNDGNTDILLRNDITGANGIWQMDGTTVTSYIPLDAVPANSGWDVVGVADFTNDGKTDILWRNSITGDNGIWQMNGATVASYISLNSVAANSGWDVVGVGDFTNDGKTDILWRNQTTGENAYWEMNGATYITSHLIESVAAQSGWDVAGVGDFNKDGKADILWRNRFDGQAAIWEMNGNVRTGVLGLSPTVDPSSGWNIV